MRRRVFLKLLLHLPMILIGSDFIQVGPDFPRNSPNIGQCRDNDTTKYLNLCTRNSGKYCIKQGIKF